MSKNPPEIAKKPTKKSDPASVPPPDPVREGINRLLFNYEVPQAFKDAYQMGLIMSLLFEPLKMGEVFRNFNYQCQRVFALFNFDADAFTDKMKAVYADYLKLIADAQEKAIRELNEKSEKTPKPKGGTKDESPK